MKIATYFSNLYSSTTIGTREAYQRARDNVIGDFYQEVGKENGVEGLFQDLEVWSGNIDRVRDIAQADSRWTGTLVKGAALGCLAAAVGGLTGFVVGLAGRHILDSNLRY